MAERRGLADQQIYKLNHAEHGSTIRENGITRQEFEHKQRSHGSKVRWWQLKGQGFVEQVTFLKEGGIVDGYRYPTGEGVFPVILKWFESACWVKQHCYERMLTRMEFELQQKEEGKVETSMEKALKDEYALKRAARALRMPVQGIVPVDIKTLAGRDYVHRIAIT